MSKSIIIANWKMNLNFKQELDLSLDLKNNLPEIGDKEIVICPSYTSLARVGDNLKESDLRLGAQNVFWEESGAYTGEISAAVLKDLGCKYVIIGHSERRQHLGETNEIINKKIRVCLENNLTPIICVGETLEHKREGHTHNIILAQVQRALVGIDLIPSQQIIIAYEPIWAIGSGQVAGPQETKDVLELIRQTLVDLWPLTIIDNNVRMIYGGSVNGSNAKDFNDLDLCGGFLVGGASLDVSKFTDIISKM